MGYYLCIILRTLHYVEGNLSVLSEDELFAVIAHEIGHNRYWHYPIYLAVGFILIFLLGQYGAVGIVFAVVSTRFFCCYTEIEANKYAGRLGLRKPLLSALSKIDNKYPAWVDYVPFLNLLAIYPQRSEIALDSKKTH